MKLILISLSLLLLYGRNTSGCGVGTHTEINNRAMEFYNNSIFGPGVIKRILQEQQPSFQVIHKYSSIKTNLPKINVFMLFQI